MDKTLSRATEHIQEEMRELVAKLEELGEERDMLELQLYEFDGRFDEAMSDLENLQSEVAAREAVENGGAA